MSIEKISNLTTNINDTPYIKAFDEFRNSREYRDSINTFIVNTIELHQISNQIELISFHDKKERQYNFIQRYLIIKYELNQLISKISSKITSNTEGVIKDSDKELIYKKVSIDIMMFLFYTNLFNLPIDLDIKKRWLDFFKKNVILPLSKSIIKNLFGDYDSIKSIDELKKIVNILKDIQNELRKLNINKNLFNKPNKYQLNVQDFKEFKNISDNILEYMIKEIHTRIGKIKEDKEKAFEVLRKSERQKKQKPKTTYSTTRIKTSPQPQQTLTQKEITQEEIIQKEVNDVLNKLNIEKSVYENINKNGNYDSFLNILKQTKELFNKYKDNINENRKAEILEKLKSSRSNFIQQRDSLQKSHNQQNANIRISNSHIHNKVHKTNELKDDDMYRRNISRIDTLSADIKYLINIIDNKDK